MKENTAKLLACPFTTKLRSLRTLQKIGSLQMKRVSLTEVEANLILAQRQAQAHDAEVWNQALGEAKRRIESLPIDLHGESQGLLEACVTQILSLHKEV